MRHILFKLSLVYPIIRITFVNVLAIKKMKKVYVALCWLMLDQQIEKMLHRWWQIIGLLQDVDKCCFKILTKFNNTSNFNEY